ncbi:hypothetical protein [Streptomyces sp. AMCC400023]|uniref:hypothetical protein n=1 Tax=Streptomyces sp. AMCC400023 TaxID=2056258 RepID=UPI001F23AA67|nr:hypothetical protein [Streptomyces sp. AMCC400023]UJV40986.1 hypothetical protein CVT30_14985 [Streptomyces sp. AMCC400023]
MDQPGQGHQPPPPPQQPGTPPGGHQGFGPPPPPYSPPPAPPGPPQAPPQQPYAQPPQPYAQQQPYAPPPYAQPPQPYAQSPHQGPEFLAVDRHNSVVIDAGGVAFEDHGASVDFSWPEIRSVHYRASGNGKALMVAVIHLDGGFFECVVEAKPRERLHQWFAHLAHVLGHYRPMG